MFSVFIFLDIYVFYFQTFKYMDVLTSSKFIFPNEFTNKINVNPSSIFMYCVIFCVCIVYFRNTNITLSIIVGLCVASIITYVIYKREMETLENTERIHKIKSDYITPIPNKITKYEDLTDLIFSIQDFYIYNPQSYELLIKSLDTFIDVYENCMTDNSLSGQLFENAKTHKLLSLNYLHSIIIMIPSNKSLIDKLNKSMNTLENLLNTYLIQIYDKNNEYTKTNGYFNSSKIIDLNISPYNQYDCNNQTQYY